MQSPHSRTTSVEAAAQLLAEALERLQRSLEAYNQEVADFLGITPASVRFRDGPHDGPVLMPLDFNRPAPTPTRN